jgi:hypothetical protein
MRFGSRFFPRATHDLREMADTMVRMTLSAVITPPRRSFSENNAVKRGLPRDTRSANLCLAWLLAISLFLIAALVLDGIARARDQDRAAAHWIKTLDLSMPAFWPAGSPQRLMPGAFPAIDLRPAPSIPARSWETFNPSSGSRGQGAP